MPEGVTAIGKCAFADCKSLEYIYLPKSIETIGDDVFEGCSSLKEIYFAGTLDEFSNVTRYTILGTSATLICSDAVVK